MEEKKITCSECGSAFIYIRIKEKAVVCRKCGYIRKLEGEKDAN